MLIYLGLAVLAYLVVVLTLQRRVLFPAPSVGFSAGKPDEAIWLETDAGPVEAWLLLGEGVSADRPGPAVIFAHGNGELIDHWPLDLTPYQRMGVSVLLIEFRGYGRSAGSPSQKAITQDAVAFYDLLATRSEVDADRIVFHGRSIGGGVTAALAKERRPAAWVLQSSFTSAADVAARFWVPRFLILDPFDVTSVLETYDGPVLIMHGKDDGIIPPSHAQRNADAAAGATLILFEGMDHNNPPPDGPYWEAIVGLLHDAGAIDKDSDATIRHSPKPTE